MRRANHQVISSDSRPSGIAFQITAVINRDNGCGLGRPLGDDAPTSGRYRRVTGQHRHAQVVTDLLRAALTAHHRLHRRVADHVVADPLAVGVVQQAAMAVDHVQVGAVAVVAQQRMQRCAGAGTGYR